MKKKIERTLHPEDKRPKGVPRHVWRSFPMVEKVIESKKRVEVAVNARDCSEGRKRNAQECALARAVKREFEADGVIIGMAFSYIIKNKKATRFVTSDSVQREIVSFDRHQDFAPGKYVLSPVSRSLVLGRNQDNRRNKSSGSNPRYMIVHKRSARVREID